ncbi:hypothetical protein ES332_A01G067500v1 [Gossypium tomentosum]|uniref:Uncharacterized protein n=1 Tax=Gossypium tomentosum TaxID=34277 RepID=A0A5D2RMG2_GOSTO|nr:hypothetical protein ES332_A01G067500v1 [Gossypium tomentosum]
MKRCAWRVEVYGVRRRWRLVRRWKSGLRRSLLLGFGCLAKLRFRFLGH